MKLYKSSVGSVLYKISSLVCFTLSLRKLYGNNALVVNHLANAVVSFQVLVEKEEQKK